MRRAALALTACTLAAGLLGACGSSGGAKSSAGPSTGDHGLTLSTLTGTSTTVVIDPAFLAKATQLHVTPAKYGTATLARTGDSESLTFPITGGSLSVHPGATPALSGTIMHQGSGLSLAAKGVDVVVDNLLIDPGTDGTLKGEVKVNGTVYAKSITLFDVDDSTATSPRIDGMKVTVGGLTLYVDPAAASALNLALGLSGSSALPTAKQAVKVGTMTIVATGS